MRKRLILTAQIAFSTPFLLNADILGYSDTVRIWAESESLIAIHDHDWSEGYLEDPKKPDLPFSKGNGYSYVEIWDREKAKCLWRSPSPAFTYLWISPDEKYIVGMSDIKRGNPYQLVVFNRMGKVMVREHVVPSKAAFTLDELNAFWKKYPEAKQHLFSRIKMIDEIYYIDFRVMNLSKLITEDAWRDLHGRSVQNPEFPFVAESTSNWVKWYHSNPNLKIVTKDKKTFLEFTSLSYNQENAEFVAGVRVAVEIPDDPIAIEHSLIEAPNLPVLNYIGTPDARPRITEKNGETYLQFSSHPLPKTLNSDPFADPFGSGSRQIQPAKVMQFRFR